MQICQRLTKANKKPSAPIYNKYADGSHPLLPRGADWFMQINQVLQIPMMFFVNTKLWEHCVRSVISDLTLCIPLFPPPSQKISAAFSQWLQWRLRSPGWVKTDLPKGRVICPLWEREIGALEKGRKDRLNSSDAIIINSTGPHYASKENSGETESVLWFLPLVYCEHCIHCVVLFLLYLRI